MIHSTETVGSTVLCIFFYCTPDGNFVLILLLKWEIKHCIQIAAKE